jgi:DNA recombination protein RmuC
MNDPAFLTAAGAAVVFLAAAVFAFTRAASLSRRLAVAEERVRQSGENADILKAQAAQSAQVVAEELVKRASETFRSQEALALERMAGQLKPVADTLAKFELQVAAIEKVRAEDAGGIKQQIAEMLKATADTQFEARKLSAALRRGAGVQGRWGEQTLRNVLEAAGLQSRFDFDEQVSKAVAGPTWSCACRGAGCW